MEWWVGTYLYYGSMGDASFLSLVLEISYFDGRTHSSLTGVASLTCALCFTVYISITFSSIFSLTFLLLFLGFSYLYFFFLFFCFCGRFLGGDLSIL